MDVPPEHWFMSHFHTRILEFFDLSILFNFERLFHHWGVGNRSGDKKHVKLFAEECSHASNVMRAHWISEWWANHQLFWHMCPVTTSSSSYPNHKLTLIGGDSVLNILKIGCWICSKTWIFGIFVSFQMNWLKIPISSKLFLTNKFYKW